MKLTLFYYVCCVFFLIITAFLPGCCKADPIDAWDQARHTDTIDAYEQMRKDFPNSIFDDVCLKRIAELKHFGIEKKFETVEQCQEFIKEYGKKTGYKDIIGAVNNRILEIQSRKIPDKPSVKQLKSLVFESPPGPKRTELAVKLVELDFQETRQMNSAAEWNRYIEEYRKFISYKHPIFEQYIQQAQQELEKLLSTIFKDLIRKDSIDGYKDFLKDCSKIKPASNYCYYARMYVENKPEDKVKILFSKARHLNDVNRVKELVSQYPDEYSITSDMKKYIQQMEKAAYEAQAESRRKKELEIQQAEANLLSKPSLKGILKHLNEVGYGTQSRKLIDMASRLTSRNKLFSNLNTASITFLQDGSGFYYTEPVLNFIKSMLKNSGFTVQSQDLERNYSGDSREVGPKADLEIQVSFKLANMTRTFVDNAGNRKEVVTGADIAGKYEAVTEGKTLASIRFAGVSNDSETKTVIQTVSKYGGNVIHVDNTINVRKHVLDSLWQKGSAMDQAALLMGKISGVQGLIEALTDYKDPMQGFIISHLKNLSGKKFNTVREWQLWGFSQSYLFRYLEKNSLTVRTGARAENRISAITALGDFEPPSHYRVVSFVRAEPLVKLLAEDDSRIQEAAKISVRKICGADLDSTKLQEWINKNYKDFLKNDASHFFKVLKGQQDLASTAGLPGTESPSAPEKTHPGEEHFKKSEEYFDSNDVVKAIECLEKASEAGHPRACTILGSYYFAGFEPYGITQDYSRARSLLQKASDAGDADGMYNLALLLIEQGMDSEGITWLDQSAQGGNSEAMFNLSVFYAKGQHVEMNQEKAMVYLENAANAGLEIAQLTLGNHYENGIIKEKNIALAKQWYREAAESGNTDAQYCLGRIALLGLDGNRDFVAAHRWFLQAAEGGDVESMVNLGVMYRSGDGVPKNSEEGIRWYRKAAEKGNEQAIQILEKLGLSK